MTRSAPKWFSLGEEVNPEVMRRIANAASSDALSTNVGVTAQMAHFFILDTMLLANHANREGMHANALAMLRQCVEAISVLELTLCGHEEMESTLAKWQEDRISAGQLRKWLQENVWQSYGQGLWAESWSLFMREFAGAVQPYAHYGRSLSQWQSYGGKMGQRSLSKPRYLGVGH